MLLEFFRGPRLLEVCQNEAAAVAVGQHRPPGNRSIDYADGDQIFFRHEGEQKLPITVMSTRTDRTLEAYHAPNRVKTPRRLGNRSREKSYCIWNLTPKESATIRIPYYDRSVPDLQSSNYTRSDRRTDSNRVPLNRLMLPFSRRTKVYRKGEVARASFFPGEVVPRCLS